jgi:hypothetical protein
MASSSDQGTTDLLFLSLKLELDDPAGSNTPHHKKRLEERQDCISEHGLVTAAVIDSVWGVEVILHLSRCQYEIAPGA